MTNESAPATRFDTTRRDLLKGLGLGLMVSTMAPGEAVAQGTVGPTRAPERINTRSLPKGGAAIPTIGLGTFLTFDVIPGQQRSHLRDVMRTYWDGGARVIDTSPLYGTAEYSVGAFASELDIVDQIFLSNKIWSTGEFVADDSHALRSLQQSMGRAMAKADRRTALPQSNQRRSGPSDAAGLEKGGAHPVCRGNASRKSLSPMRLQAGWSAARSTSSRSTTQSSTAAPRTGCFRLAADRGIGVMVNMPLEKARLHKVVEGRALPAFAREVRRRELGPVFSEVGGLQPDRDVRFAVNVKSGACPGKHRCPHGTASDAGHADANDQTYGDVARILRDRQDVLVPRQALSGDDQARAGCDAVASLTQASRDLAVQPLRRRPAGGHRCPARAGATGLRMGRSGSGNASSDRARSRHETLFRCRSSVAPFDQPHVRTGRAQRTTAQQAEP